MAGEPRPGISDVLPLLRDVLEDAAAADGFLERLPIFVKTTPLSDECRNASQFAANAEIGPYRLIRELGAGGMSVVWLAERSDGAVNRPVALKLPLARADRALGERLARERDILAPLNHPHIARLYDAGISAKGHLSGS